MCWFVESQISAMSPLWALKSLWITVGDLTEGKCDFYLQFKLIVATCTGSFTEAREEALPEVSCVSCGLSNGSNYQSQFFFGVICYKFKLFFGPQLCYFFWHLHKQILICSNSSITFTNLCADDWLLQMLCFWRASWFCSGEHRNDRGPRHSSN